MPLPQRVAVTVRGIVQGVGFRPFAYQAATARGLTGWVRNDADVVRIEVQGDSAALDSFLDALRHSAPSQSRIDALEAREIEPVPVLGGVAESFQILASDGAASPRPTIPADLAMCPECLAEIRDASQRRHKYPFTNCTNCGPRWSIIEQLPYDRQRTSMAGFAMCDACRAEYTNPADRRFHAQPIACPDCGPRVQLLDCLGHATSEGESAMGDAVQAVLDGRIVAMKGLGGFQLLVDATNTEAVVRLRERKRRPERPFALMMPSLEIAQQYCRVSPVEAQELMSPAAPIVLLRRAVSPGVLPLSASIAPGNPCLGVMLPYTPLHHLLVAAVGRPMVCTSGNLSEEPMAILLEDAIVRLGPIADVMLTHDRPIVRPVDDSIVRCDGNGIQILRRARGFAPQSIVLQNTANRIGTVLAVGGHLKNTVALGLPSSVETQVVMSAHIGDLDGVLSVDVFRRAVEDLVQFFHATPDAIACDLHPDYASTHCAEEFAERWSVPLLRMQHHHAHVAACMAEQELQGPVLGFAWDGTGYGIDGTVWGGETLICDAATFRRVAHLRTFPLPGGDRASREPRRSALGVLFEMIGGDAVEYACQWFNRNQCNTLLAALSRSINTPRTSSMGRLFDAVAALCGLPGVATFEGQAAMSLEFAADEQEASAYSIPLSNPRAENGSDAIVADWAPMLRSILADRAAGVPVRQVSARFHHALAEMAVAIAESVAPTRELPVVLSGGCFQNALLADLVRMRLSAAGFCVYTHQTVPPGDGGIALGQTWIALRQP